ncbi:hypothetical protein GCM10027447_34930 [Glycomyces halotolerans]
MLGPDHPQTLMTRYNLAFWRGQAGDAATAATDLKALEDDTVRILGSGHPLVQAARDGLEYWQERATDNRCAD